QARAAVAQGQVAQLLQAGQFAARLDPQAPAAIGDFAGRNREVGRLQAADQFVQFDAARIQALRQDRYLDLELRHALDFDPGDARQSLQAPLEQGIDQVAAV